MSEPEPVLKEIFWAQLPSPWPDKNLRNRIAGHLARTGRCVVALDDDPTGTQTVHDVWVIARWEIEDIRTVLADGEPAVYILTNSRSMTLAEAKAINREIAGNLLAASRLEGRPVTVVSRSDSTLRGHHPGETDALAEKLAAEEDKPFDGICVIPFFLEGGRFTIDDVHWVQEDEWLVPAAQTPYAKDAVFGYRHSRLPEWVEEKTEGRVNASDVVSISIDMLRTGGPARVARRLRSADRGSVIIVNAAEYRDLEVFVSALQTAEAEGKRFLFRTAASFVKVAAGLPDRPLLSGEELVGSRPSSGGLIVVGSYVPKSTAQLAAAKSLDSVLAIELSVPLILDGSSRGPTISGIAAQLDSAIASGSNAVLYTNRDLIEADDHEANLAVGKAISSALVQTVRRIEHEPRFMVGKGGITSSDLATDALDIRRARVLGQIIPGVPVWKLGPDCRWPGMPYVVFPGNVGRERSLADIIQLLDSCRI